MVDGRTLAEIARNEGISREWASREANSPETRQIIVDLVARHRPAIDELFELSIEAIRSALQAQGHHISQYGQVIELGADHYARMTAVGRLWKLLTVGRPIPKPPDEAQKSSEQLTWDKFREAYQGSRPMQ